MLLRRGADAAAEDEQGCDAGFLAKRAGHHECQQILVQHSRGRFNSLAAQTITGSLDVAMVIRADVCQVTEDGSTLLTLAAKHGHAHLLSHLVKFETCPLDYRQMKLPDLLDTSMELSAGLRGLPESGEHPFKSALHFAAQGGYLHCVQILLDAHSHPSLPDCDGWLPLHHACDSEHVDIVRLILNYPSTLVLSGLRPAMNLAKGRCNNDIITLLEEAVLRRQNEIVTPMLFDAAVSGNADLLFTILENGDDVNPLKEESCDWPLLLAAGFGYLEIVEHLFKFGGHVTQANPKTGNTPLHVAARGGRENVVSYLLTFTRQAGTSHGGEGEGGEERGRDVNCRNKSGATPLELTVAQGQNSIVQLLLDSGASCCLPDSNGQLLTCAEFAGIQFILETYRRERIGVICGALERAASLEEFQTIWQGPWDYNLRAESGDTVLMAAAQHAPLEVVRFLLTEASSAPPTVLVAGGIPTPSPGRRMVCSPDDSEHAMSDAHPSLTPRASRKDYVDSWDPERPASVVPFHISPGRRRRRHTGVRSYNRFPVQRGSNRAPSPLRLGPGRSGPSGASNASSGEDEGGRGVPDAAGSEPSIASNSGICTTIIRATNPHDGQTAAHRAALAGKQENLSLLLHYDPECVLAKDLVGDTPLHLACRGTQKKTYRKIVEMLLGCDRVVASAMNKKGQRPEDDCPNTKTRKLVIKKRTKETFEPDIRGC
jgi:ankyrin repeat protein